MVSEIDLSYCSLPVYYPVSPKETQVVSRTTISPSTEARIKLDFSMWIGLAKIKELQDTFWKDFSLIIELDKSTTEQDTEYFKEKWKILGKAQRSLAALIRMVGKDFLERNIKENMTIGQFFLKEKYGTVLSNLLITQESVPASFFTQKDRLALAWKYIELDHDIGFHIHKYNIEDQQELWKLFEKNLANAPINSLNVNECPRLVCINNFGLKDINKVLFLLEAAIVKWPQSVVDAIRNLKLSDPVALVKFTKLLTQSPIFNSFSYLWIFCNQSSIPWSDEDWCDILRTAESCKKLEDFFGECYWQSIIEPQKILKFCLEINPSEAITQAILKHFNEPIKEDIIFDIFCAGIKKTHAQNSNLSGEINALFELINLIKNFRSPLSRKEIINQLADFTNEAFLKNWAGLIKGKKRKDAVTHTMIPALLLLSCTKTKEFSQVEGVVSDFINSVRKERYHFRNAHTMHLLVKFLLKLNGSNELSLDQKIGILSQVFVDKDISARLRSLTMFLYLDKGTLIAKSEPIAKEDLMLMCHNLVSDAFHVDKEEFGGDEAFDALYIKRVEDRFRDKDALMVYAGKINALESPGKEAMQQAYSKFVNALLSDNYYSLRNQSPQMIALMKLKGGEAIAKIWNDSPLFEPLSNYIGEESSETVSFSLQFKKFLKEKLQTDNHIKDLPKHLPYLNEFLSHGKSVEALLKELSIEKDSPKIQLQKCCLKLCQSDNKDDKLLADLAEILNNLKDEEKTIWDEFQRDISAFSSSLSDTLDSNMTIGITNDPCDMLLLAREAGGCQTIDGEPETNKSALAYVIDGKNSAIVIKDKEGRIKARAILRLLFDKKTKKPVLFLERHYCLGVANNQLNKAINSYAITYATNKLSVPLLTTEAILFEDDKDGYTKYGPIVSVGSNAPYEYSDAGGGQNEGKFTIPSSFVMYDPSLVVSDSPLDI